MGEVDCRGASPSARAVFWLDSMFRLLVLMRRVRPTAMVIAKRVKMEALRSVFLGVTMCTRPGNLVGVWGYFRRV